MKLTLFAAALASAVATQVPATVQNPGPFTMTTPAEVIRCLNQDDYADSEWKPVCVSIAGPSSPDVQRFAFSSPQPYTVGQKITLHIFMEEKGDGNLQILLISGTPE